MRELTLSYKQDAYGNDITALVFLPDETPSAALPIGTAFPLQRHKINAYHQPALIFHLGGFIVGSAAAVPKAQIQHLLGSGFAVVVPNYRLAPQITAKQAFQDCEDAYEWAIGALPATITHQGGPSLDPSTVVAMGHSSGGTLALHLASCKSIKAATAFYPSLLLSDTSTSAHKPTMAPPFGGMPDYEPSAEDWASIAPQGRQISEAPLAAPGSVPAPRNKWQMQIIKSGQWMPTVQPDGDFAAIDPLTRLTGDWPPVMIVQGEVDNVPGSSFALAQRADKEMKDAGVEKVALEIVPGQGHVFDLPPGASQAGDPRWVSVVRGLDWLTEHRAAPKRTPNWRARVPQLDVHIRYV